VDEPRDALLPDAALAGDEHGRVHCRCLARELEHPPHRPAVRDDSRGILPERASEGESAFVHAKLPLGLLELVGDPLQDLFMEPFS
jgi:hypothetical protein